MEGREVANGKPVQGHPRDSRLPPSVAPQTAVQAPAFAAQVAITAEQLDGLVLSAARKMFAAEGLKLKQAALVKRAEVVRQVDGGVVVGIRRERS